MKVGIKFIGTVSSLWKTEKRYSQLRKNSYFKLHFHRRKKTIQPNENIEGVVEVTLELDVACVEKPLPWCVNESNVGEVR